MTPQEWDEAFAAVLVQRYGMRPAQAMQAARTYGGALCHLEPEQAASSWALQLSPWRGRPAPGASSDQRSGADIGMGQHNREHTSQVIDDAMRRPVRKP